jgi:hypothetical protein
MRGVFSRKHAEFAELSCILSGPLATLRTKLDGEISEEET